MKKGQLKSAIKDLSQEKFAIRTSDLRFREIEILKIFNIEKGSEIFNLDEAQFSQGKVLLSNLVDEAYNNIDYNLIDDLKTLIRNN